MNDAPADRSLTPNHTGITVRDLDRSLAFWQQALGFELSHRVHHTGQLASEVTGVPGAEISIAVLNAPGHRIELLQYHAPADRKAVDARPCDIGFMHIAFTVEDLQTLLTRMASYGWQPAGQPQRLETGPNAGRKVVYVRDPDGITIELMQPPNHNRDC